MIRWHAVWRTVALAACAALGLAGCPGSGISPALPGGMDAGAQLSEGQAFRVLGAVVEAGPAAAQPAPVLEDDQPYFGEQAALYRQVGPEAVELPEDSIVAETETPLGADPPEAGRLAGRFWNDLPDSSSDQSGGLFRGRWFSADGQVRGVLRGRYEPLPAGELPQGLTGGGWFQGRYIDNQGRLRGVLRGRYGHTAGRRGFFFGHWLDRSLHLVGVLKGHWVDDPAINGGWFAGRWAAFDPCGEAESLPGPEVEGLSEAEVNELEGLQLADLDQGQYAPLWEAQDALAPGVEELRAGQQPPCAELDRPHGFLGGWHVPFPPDDDRRGGLFRGRWLDADRNVRGAVLGRYLPRSSGAGGTAPDTAGADQQQAAVDSDSPGAGDMPAADVSAEEDGSGGARGPHWAGVFYGKIVDRFGQPRGYLRGLYGTGRHGLGVFRGRYFGRDRQPLGRLRGRWGDDPHRRGGPFFGVWFGSGLDGGG